MSQHDFNIANQGFPAFRADLNNALGALATNSAGSTEPSTTYAYQYWYDETANLLKMRNAADDAWITLAFFDQTNDEWEVRSAVIQAVDSAGVVIKTDDGTTRIEVQDDGDVSIDSGTLFVDASANSVGIGTSSPLGILDASYGGYTAAQKKALVVGADIGANTSRTSNTRKIGTIAAPHYDNGNEIALMRVDSYSSATDLMIGGTGELRGATSIQFRTASTTTAAPDERMRIDSSGNLLVGSQTAVTSVGTYGLQLYTGSGSQGRINAGKTASGTASALANYHNGSYVGGVTYSDTATAFPTSSDYRLKEDWRPMEDSIDRIKSLNPVNFAWKLNGERVDGFLAHEAQEIVPEAVTGTKDAMRTEEYVVEPSLGDIYVPASEAILDEEGNVVTEAQDEQIVSSDVERPETLEEGQQWRETTPAVMGEREVPDYQGIDQAKLVPLLTGALQEAIAKIEALEARVQALES